MNKLPSVHFTLLKKFVNNIPISYGAILDYSNLDSLFANTPLDKTIPICNDNLNNDDQSPPKIPKNHFRNLLKRATKASSFMSQVR